MKINNQSPEKEKAGFTLVEVVIGMTLMALVFTAAFGAYFLGVRIVEDSRDQLRASQIIQSELEYMRTMNWIDLSDMTSGNFTPQGNFVQKFARDYNTHLEINDMNATQKQVIIRVTWKNSRGDFRRQVFNTIFTRFGLNDYYYRQV